MYISKFELDLCNAVVQEALGDSDKMHKLVWSLFEGYTDFVISRHEFNILYRVIEMSSKVIWLEVHSEIEPNNCPCGLNKKYCVTDDTLKAKLQSNPIVRFNILVNPIQEIDGKRRAIKSLNMRKSWFKNKALHCGFEIINFVEAQNYFSNVCKKNNNFYFNVSEFRGVLRITDFDLFYKNVVRGIGREKSYGMGMFLFSGV